MTPNEILEKVRSIVADQLCLELSQVRPDANFSTELGADSLDVVELVIALEEGFEIEIPDDAASEISTVEEAVNYIRKKLDEKELNKWHDDFMALINDAGNIPFSPKNRTVKSRMVSEKEEITKFFGLIIRRFYSRSERLGPTYDGDLDRHSETTTSELRFFTILVYETTEKVYYVEDLGSTNSSWFYQCREVSELSNTIMTKGLDKSPTKGHFLLLSRKWSFLSPIWVLGKKLGIKFKKRKIFLSRWKGKKSKTPLEKKLSRFLF